MDNPGILLAVTLLVVVGGVALRIVVGRAGRNDPSLLDTGLKAIDLFVPLPLGSDILITGDERSGATLLGTEIAGRMLNHPSRKLQVQFYLDAALEDIDERVAELQEVLPAMPPHVVSVVTTEDIDRHREREQTHHGIAIFAVSKDERFLHFFRQVIRDLRDSSADAGPATSFVVTETIVPTGFDVTIFSTKSIAQEGLFPALDLSRSSSAASADPAIPAKRRRVADSARTAIANITENLYPGAINDPQWSYCRNENQRPALQALCFMSQPYFVAEPFTGKKAAFVRIQQTVDGFATILSSRAEAGSHQSLQYKNALSE